MTPELWQRVKSALHQAMELGVERRPDLLEQIASADPQVRVEVESLLAANDAAGEEFLSRSAWLSGPLPEDEPADPLIGRTLGPYRIIEELGAGGMGEVYRAMRWDDEFRRAVAIKLVRAGQGSRYVLRRLRSERQILADLDHPNITRLLDGGTTEEGVPYLVMELIEGRPIHEYCAGRELGVNERLRLFIEVCSAVQYAHQRLIIHRDIKPGNILVTPGGVPKLLDFGIAKILEESRPPERGAVTASMVRLFTPAYASPEQLKGAPVTTATDIYSLGIVLCELLTGRGPGDFGHTERGAPLRPSAIVLRSPPRAERSAPAGDAALARRLAGDLDNIVLKAMHPDPERRYSSAEQFAADVHRHLQHLPVIARPDTLIYRISAFSARHTAGLSACVLLSIAFASAAAAIWNEAQVAQRERARAERRFEDVRHLANALMGEIYESVSDLPGATPARRLIVSNALEYLDNLARDAAGDAPLERELAQAYSLVGDVQGNGYYANLGNPAAALASYRKALAIRARLAAGSPRDARAVRELAGSYLQVGVALESLRDFSDALASYRAAAELRERIDASARDPKVLDELAGTYFYLASDAVRAGLLQEAQRSVLRAIAIRSTIVAADPALELAVRTHSAGDHSAAAQILAGEGRFAPALEEAERALEIMRSLAHEQPNNQTIRTFVGSATIAVGELEERLGKPKDATESYRLGLTELEAVLTADPQNAHARRLVARGYERIGAIESQSGELTRGIAHLERALTLAAASAAANREDPEVRALFADSDAALGQADEQLAEREGSDAERLRSLNAAHALYTQSLERWRDLESRGLLDASERDQPAAVARLLARNEAALAPRPLD
ncbi:MAG TPA: serine/threonine-protein kinase [Steroidobacteraceae bacterium]|nr:serine/threonine-protein kinase [Steroidobacteraceae bacterium]